MKRVTVRYEGWVQGVGFRYATLEMAHQREVTGFVRNGRDGRVELVVEGVEQEILALLDDIRKSHLGRYIQAENISWSEVNGSFKNFKIAYQDET